VSKFIVNAIATKLAKHFSLDKIMSYVFDENDLDKKVKEIEGRIELLEVMQQLPKKFKCECGKEG
jgi:hypothetical protein|tara:strand:- start:533 stop:727 length:195 start_codon:yes stop_codon:yes gene_type:complete